MPLRLRIGRFLARWLVPPGLRDAQRQLRSRMRERRTLARSRELLAPNAELRDRHAGQRCFVIGNGPSLASHDLAPLADEVTFAASGFWKHPIVERWQPTYYCFADPLFFDGTEPSRAFFADLRTRIRSSTFLVPLEAARAVAEQELLPAGSTRYVAFSGELREGLAGRPDLTRAVPGVINVVLLSIMAAMHMGCSRIYLIGLDHDWLSHRGKVGHFYASRTIERHAEAPTRLSAWSYKLLMENQLDLWRSYEAILAVAERCGIRIVNATDGGFLDVFERERYEDVVAAKAPEAKGSRG